MTLDGDKLVFNLKEPFKALLNSNTDNSWLPIVDVWRTRYYRYIVELSREVEVARSFLNPAGLFSGLAVA